MKVRLTCVCALLLTQYSAYNVEIYPAWMAIDANTKSTNVFLSIIENGGLSPWMTVENPVRKALASFPLIDGHNDFPFLLYMNLNNDLTTFDFNRDLQVLPGWEMSHTDLPRLKEGKVGGQFWSAFVFCETQYKDAVAKTLQQIDVIKRLVKKNFEHMQFVTTADGIVDAFKDGKIASLIGVEGGHSIDSSLAVLRMYYDLGVRYLTLSHTCDTPWSGSSMIDEQGVAYNQQSGLTSFGRKVVLEMNRLGMLVDISHVSLKTMFDTLEVSMAPVIFSHSSVYSVYPHPRNVPDDILSLLKNNRGIVMINFYSGYVGEDNPTLETVAAHINHVVDLIGPEHVGLGSDFDGIPKTVEGLDDVSKFPDLLEVLFYSNPERWTQLNLERLIGRNLVRVFKEVEKVRDELAYAEPLQHTISEYEFNRVKDESLNMCRTEFEKDIYEKIFNQPQNSTTQ